MKNLYLVCSVLLTMTAVCAAGPTKLATTPATIDVFSMPELSTSVGKLLGSTYGVDFSIDASSCALYGSGLKDYCYLKVDNMKPAGRPGEPQLPMKVIEVVIPGQNNVLGVEVKSGKLAALEEPLKIVPVPQAAEWRIGGGRPELIPDPLIYGSDACFPGKLVSFDWGCDNKDTHVYVRIFPVQYRPLSGRAFVLTQASIVIYYGPKVSRTATSPAAPFADQCVIICPAEFQAAAETLEIVHEIQEGISTHIATCEWIGSTYAAATDSPPWLGYAHEQPGCIAGYDYALAKKIVAFLRDTLAHPNLKYITIIGDAAKVPPSYYFKFDSSSPVERWLPSDILYASPDYDYVLNYCSGRLVASDTLEAMHVATKIRDWHASVNWSWYKNAVVTGGDPFASYDYVGELITSDVVNRNALNGHAITKLYFTDGTFTKSACEDYLQGASLADCGTFFQISHGSGTAIYYDDGSNISASQLMSYTQHTNVPVVASVACDCGTWDTDLVDSLFFSMSFGEGVLKSEAAGIAYYGGARSNAGAPSWYIDNGNLVITRDWYMSEFLTYVWDAYHNGATTLGEMHQAAFDSFLANNAMPSDAWNQKTYFGAILLGDPALQVPSQVSGPDYTLPWLSAQDPDYLNSSHFPVFHHSESETISVASSTDSPGVRTKLMNAHTRSAALDSENFGSAPFEYGFAPKDGPSFYLVRTIADDSKEGWMYLHNGKLIAVDGDTLDWRKAGISPAGLDPDDFGPNDLELTDMYGVNDGGYWYIGFSGFCDTMWHAMYGIALDYAPGGYSGIQGSSRDGLLNWITFDSTHAVDAEIYVCPAYGVAVVYFWLGSAWSGASMLEDLGGVFWLDMASAHFCEIGIPSSLVGDPDCIYLSVFSTGMGSFAGDYQPAQDATPSDSATYHSPHWGQSWANTLTQFAQVCKTGVAEKKETVSMRAWKFALSQPSPNPFRDVCSIRFTLPEKGPVELRVYNSAGELVSVPVKGTATAGTHVFNWRGLGVNGEELSNGIYFARLNFKGESRTAKMTMVR